MPGRPSIVLASAWPHGTQSMNPPAIGQILHIEQVFYRIIHFIATTSRVVP